MPLVSTLLKRLYADWRLNDRKSIYKMMSHARPVEAHFEGMEARHVKQADIRTYMLKRKDEGVSNATINREMAVLSRAFRLALEAEEIDRAPVFKKLKESNVRQGTYTREEVDRIMAELPAQHRPLMLYAYLTGRRLGEIKQLRWDDVDLKRRLITVRQAVNKAGVPDTIPLEGELYTLLLDLWEVHRENCPFVFNRKGHEILDFQATFRRARERAGLPGKLFHDLRRTFATDAIEAGVPEAIVMKQTGHKTHSMLLRYNIVRSDAVRDGMVRVEEFRRGKEGESA